MELTGPQRSMLIQRVSRVIQDGAYVLKAVSADELAERAVDAVLTPQTWSPGDTIPPEVDAVEDSEGFRWNPIRIRDGQPTGWWQCTHAPHFTEAELLEKFGTVRECPPDGFGSEPDSGPVTGDWPTVGEPCPRCRSLPTALDTTLIKEVGGTVRCPRCKRVWVDRGRTVAHDVMDRTICTATHPEHGWQCQRMAGHDENVTGDPQDEGQWHSQVGTGRWMTIPASTVTFPAGDDTPLQKAARALAFVNYLIDQGDAPGTATITKKMVNRARGRALDLQDVLRELEKHS